MDRKTGYLWLRKCNTRKAEEVYKATISLLAQIKDQLKTITADNGEGVQPPRTYCSGVEFRLVFCRSL